MVNDIRCPIRKTLQRKRKYKYPHPFKIFKIKTGEPWSGLAVWKELCWRSLPSMDKCFLIDMRLSWPFEFSSVSNVLLLFVSLVFPDKSNIIVIIDGCVQNSYWGRNIIYPLFLKECENVHREINIKPYVLNYPVEEMDQANQTIFS